MQKLILIFLFFIPTVMAAPLLWQPITPGLEFTKINFLGGLGRGLYAFRVDLNEYRLQLAFIDQRNLGNLTELVARNKAVIGVNGGFFSPDFKSLGLRISEGRIKNPMKYTPWWGIFYTKSNSAYIVSQKQFQHDSSIDFAVQSGPRLIVNGQIPALKPGVADRTALGITKDGKVILLATDNFPLTTQELAEIMRDSSKAGGLDCVDALNLDGGSSTQLYAKTKNFTLSIPSFASVADAVLVVPR